MSEEKLYAIKNDYGDWADKYYNFGFCAWVTPDKNMREEEAKNNGGHVVTLIEEPEKVVLTKEQAEIVEGARDDENPATYISDYTDEHDDNEILLMGAYVNGYTVEKEKKYVVYKELGGKQNKDIHTGYAQACRALSNSETMFWVLTKWIINDKGAKFTEKEISDYGLQDCEKFEVTDDEQ